MLPLLRTCSQSFSKAMWISDVLYIKLRKDQAERKSLFYVRWIIVYSSLCSLGNPLTTKTDFLMPSSPIVKVYTFALEPKKFRCIG